MIDSVRMLFTHIGHRYSECLTDGVSRQWALRGV